MTSSEPPSNIAWTRCTVFLRSRLPPRLSLGHPWVYRTEIARVDALPATTDNTSNGSSSPGPQPCLAEVRDASGRFVGRGIWSPVSAIAVRLLTHRPGEQLDQALFAARAREALALRAGLLVPVEPGTSACRLVFAEGDGLPGLIVDKFGPALVFQSLALAAEVTRDAVLKQLADALQPQYLIERNDVRVRTLEGLPERKGPWSGIDGDSSLPDGGRVTIVEEGVRMIVDLLEGQKTGYYLDQRDNRAAVRRLAAGLAATLDRVDVLDCFTYSGGFAAAAALGAGDRLGRLVCIDSSEQALALAETNLELNGYGGRAEFIAGNAFDELRRMDRERATGQYDLIVLDPPPFARERRMVEGALRGYKEINLRAMKLLRPNGYLVTCTCSHHLDRVSFLAALTEAAADAEARMQVVEVRGQPVDHPVRLGYPEGDYLKCYILRKLARH